MSAPAPFPKNRTKAQQTVVNNKSRGLCRYCQRPFRRTHHSQEYCIDHRDVKSRLAVWTRDHQAELFAPPEPTPAKQTIQERFDDWLHANPRTWALIRGYAFQYLEKWLTKQNRKRIGVDVIVGRVRYECSLNSDGDFAINNSFRSRIARKLIAEDARFGDLLEVRALKTE